MPCWFGVDVGAQRKGFDLAIVDGQRLLELRGRLRPDDVATAARVWRPLVIGIDSPRSCAPPGERSRAGERALGRAVCGIRYTPDAAEVGANPYYAWIVEGLHLFAALAELTEPGAEPGSRCDLLEVFPTAAWTRWIGPRGTRSRAQWSRDGLGRLGLEGAERARNQDQRDAIAAALTARQHSFGETETFGQIVVPRGSGVRP